MGKVARTGLPAGLARTTMFLKALRRPLSARFRYDWNSSLSLCAICVGAWNTVTAAPDGAGYRAVMELIMSGPWNIVVRANPAGKPVRATFPIDVR